jgi:methylenetetrahydrofolate dehydrogenase (NADP+)/methenyltetrahydrofolate cyclohydrolase
MDIIDGKAISEQILEELRSDLVGSKNGRPPCVAFIRVGKDPASVSYVNKKQKVAASLGIESQLRILPIEISQEELIRQVDQLNRDNMVDGILVQAPLPEHIDSNTIFNRVDPDKDVDGFNVMNAGRLCQEDPDGFLPCTPAGIVELLKRSDVETSGKHVVVLGRSLIVGKPAGLLMMRQHPFGNATVTICHSRTKDLAAVASSGDILIAAIGKPRFVTEDMVKPGAIVIDVGINRIEDPSRKSGYRLVGDVDFDAVAPKTSLITPVPGGVGPMTVALLMRNTIQAYRKNIFKVSC